LCFFLPVINANQPKNEKLIELCNERDLNKNINKINLSVQYVYKNWDWELARELIDKSVILVEFKNYWILYGIHNINESFTPLNFENSIDTIFSCLNKSNKIPYLLINKKNTPKPGKENQFFHFLYKNQNDGLDEYTAVKKYFNRILLVNLESTSSNSLEELELTITHEALHLFGQDNIHFTEPFYKFNKINEDQLIGINQNPRIITNGCELQQSSMDILSSREYLQYKVNCHTAFNESVIKETCLDLNLLKFIVQTNNIKDNDTRLQAVFLLKEIIKEIEKRSTIDGEDRFALEWYWYLMEGVPQYMEQRILLEKNQQKLISQYQLYCKQENGYEEYFYPLLTGAAVWHGLDYLFESTDDWTNIARYPEYNFPSPTNSKLWFDSFHQLLNNRMNQLVFK
jgi:hypothetical protein